jgi:hypothetical protein
MSSRKAPKEAQDEPDRNKPWSKVVGKHPYNVQAIERPEKGLEIYLRFKDPEKLATGARDARTWRPTGLLARQQLGRKWDKSILKQAEALADELQYTLRSEAVAPPAAPADDPAPPVRVAPAPLSIARGVALATAVDGSGMVSAPMVDGERQPGRETKEIISRSRTLLRVLVHYTRPTPESDGAKIAPNWNTFTPIDADYIVRTLAAEHRAAGAHGFSVAMRVVDEFYRMSRWLKEQGLIDREACIPRVKWKVAAKKLWEKEAGARPIKRRPRHSRLEMSPGSARAPTGAWRSPLAVRGSPLVPPAARTDAHPTLWRSSHQRKHRQRVRAPPERGAASSPRRGALVGLPAPLRTRARPGTARGLPPVR